MKRVLTTTDTRAPGHRAIDRLGHESTRYGRPSECEDRIQACAERCVRVRLGGKSGLERPKQRNHRTTRMLARLRHRSWNHTAFLAAFAPASSGCRLPMRIPSR